MRTPRTPESKPAARGPTEASAATRQRFVDAAVAYLLGERELAPADEGRRTTTLRGGAGRRDPERPSPDTLGIRLVAQLAGATHAAPLYYFPDRTCLIAAVAAEGFRRLRAELAHGGPRRAGGAGLPKVVEAAFRYVQWAGAHPALFTAMYDPALAADLELLQQAALSGASVLDALGARHGGDPRAIGRRAEAFEELLAAKVALVAFFSDGVHTAVGERELSGEASEERLTYALTSMADGLAWQRITEPQGAHSLLDRHARACFQLLLQGIGAAGRP